MNKEKIKWCCRKKRGIELIEQKEHLEKSYIKESEEDLKQVNCVGEKWKAIIGYYSCYEALYSLLMKCGIKSEIHECTIELMELFGFDEKEIWFMQTLKRIREENQYYLKREKLINKEEIQEFIFKCKEISESLNSEKIEKIRRILNEIQK